MNSGIIIRLNSFINSVWYYPLYTVGYICFPLETIETIICCQQLCDGFCGRRFRRLPISGLILILFSLLSYFVLITLKLVPTFKIEPQMAASTDNFFKLFVGLRDLILLLTQSKRFYVSSRTPSG